MVDCRIRFDDSSMSRYQCTLNYESNKGWTLLDGTFEKRSTNGTWLFVEEEYEIYEGMIFKAGKTLFEAHIL
jgi:pSer/pThr/pTyr-binding forkhead associated (FHA) protein